MRVLAGAKASKALQEGAIATAFEALWAHHQLIYSVFDVYAATSGSHAQRTSHSAPRTARRAHSSHEIRKCSSLMLLLLRVPRSCGGVVVCCAAAGAPAGYRYAATPGGVDFSHMSINAYRQLLTDCEFIEPGLEGLNASRWDELFVAINAAAAKSELYNHKKGFNRQVSRIPCGLDPMCPPPPVVSRATTDHTKGLLLAGIRLFPHARCRAAPSRARPGGERRRGPAHTLC